MNCLLRDLRRARKWTRPVVLPLSRRRRQKFCTVRFFTPACFRMGHLTPPGCWLAWQLYLSRTRDFTEREQNYGGNRDLEGTRLPGRTGALQRGCPSGRKTGDGGRKRGGLAGIQTRGKEPQLSPWGEIHGEHSISHGSTTASRATGVAWASGSQRMSAGCAPRGRRQLHSHGRVE